MDAWTIDELQVPGIVLMEHAGRAVAERVLDVAPRGPVLVLTGPGNNGGDGWVLARHLWGRGVAAPVIAMKGPRDLKGDAAQAAAMFHRAASALGWRAPDDGPAWRAVTSAQELTEAVARFGPVVVVDALFGTGLSRGLEGLAGDLVAAVADVGVPVLAVDLPSGLPTDGEAPKGPCVEARWTVTFGARKIAHASEPGRFLCGDVRVVDIGLQAPAEERAAIATFRAPPLDALRPPAPRESEHKGSFGHVALLEGSPRTAGAARLAARGALRAGAGLVTLLVDDPAAGASRDLPEVMHRALASDEALDGIDAVVLGPGLGRDEASLERGRRVLAAARDRDLPVVVDADALPLLLEGGPALRAVATPHPGEAGRLLGTSTKDVQADRLAAARALHQASTGAGHRVTWILKGACPVVLDEAGRAVVCEGGSVPLAVGGSGDVLAGVLGALLARGLSLDGAALLGAVAHQEAGRGLAQRARRGFLASEIADEVQRALYEAPNEGDRA